MTADQLKTYHSLLEGELNLICSHRLESRLEKAVKYSVFPGGKRIRPMMAMAICHDLGGDPLGILPAAAAIEILHCASLIHDDLPALDNDEMRRGQPSCHVAFGEATAILAGDVMVSLAIEHALMSAVGLHHRGVIATELASAYRQLCNGQQLDLLPADERGALYSLYALKTGALFGAACVVGACGARRTSDFCEKIKHFGILLGVLFQLQDDLIDAEPERKGRSTSSDSRNQKTTARTSISEDEIARRRVAANDVLCELENASSTFDLFRALATDLF